MLRRIQQNASSSKSSKESQAAGKSLLSMQLLKQGNGPHQIHINICILLELQPAESQLIKGSNRHAMACWPAAGPLPAVRAAPPPSRPH